MQRFKTTLISLILCALPGLAFGDGSIVINDGAPGASSMYRSVSGEARTPDTSWSEIQIMDALRSLLRAEFGEGADALPVTLNRRAREASFFNPQMGRYETVSYADIVAAFE